jgi:hypothetical protein
MKFLKRILDSICRWISTPDLDQERFEELERKKTRRAEWF